MRQQGQVIEVVPRKKYRVRVHLGDSRYKMETVYGSKRTAQRHLAGLISKHAGSMGAAAPTNATVEAYFDWWATERKKGSVAVRTYQSYVANIRRYVLPKLGKKRLAKVTSDDVQRLYGDMGERGLSPRTIRYVHAVLNQMFSTAARKKDIVRVPTADASPPAMAKAREFTVLTAEQVQELLDKAEGLRWEALYHLFFFTGLRPGEAFGLKWSDIDLDNGMLRVQRAVTWDDGRRVKMGPTKTDRSRRSIPLSLPILQVLERHRRRTRGLPNPDNLVFAKLDGGTIHPENWSKSQLKRLLRSVGAPKGFRLYDTRHTCATLMLLAGVHPLLAAERLGHSSVNLTLNTYTHVLPSMQGGVSQAMTALLYGEKEDRLSGDLEVEDDE